MKALEQAKARHLRSEGQSVKQIARMLGVSRGSVSRWVQDIPLSPAQRERLAENAALNRRVFAQCIGFEQSQANRREAELRHQQFREHGYRQAEVDDSFRVICALYWGEGDKSKNGFRIYNSDPSLLNVILRWLVRSGYESIIRFSVQYHPGNGIPEAVIRQWWLLQLPLLRKEHLLSFFPCSISRASQQKLIGKLPYGTASLVVNRLELYFNVMGGIDFLRQKGD
jgi:transcriptional regulator with XRE-family HTH domain